MVKHWCPVDPYRNALRSCRVSSMRQGTPNLHQLWIDPWLALSMNNSIVFFD
jgi:hypothetical protein